jgi:hypothetical protein
MEGFCPNRRPFKHNPFLYPSAICGSLLYDKPMQDAFMLCEQMASPRRRNSVYWLACE